MKTCLYSILIPAVLCASPTSSAAGFGKTPAAAAYTAAGGDSLVYLPLNREVALSARTGSTRSFGREEFDKYPSLDFRNLLTGVIPGLEVVEKSGATGISAASDNAAVNLLARGNAIRYIVDDMPVYITQLQLDPEQIESVTLLTDIADKAQFGPTAADGVLYIRTRRGGRGPLSVRIGFERGVSVVDRFPEWVDGVDYAKMNNYARYNDGMTPLYGNAALEGYRMRDPDHAEYPNADFRAAMLKDTKPYTRAGIGLSGGGSAVRYNAHFGYAGEGDIYRLGAVSDYNRLNVHTNIDASITRRLRARVSFFGGMTFRRSPKYGYGTSNDDEMTAVLADLTTIPAIAFPVHVTPEALDESVEMEKNRAIYGVGNQWSNNPVAALSENGSYTTKGRTGLVTATVDYDCSSFAKGLKSTTFLGLNLYQMTRIGQNPDYYGYLWDRQMGVGAISAHKGAKESGKSLMDKYTYQSLNFYERLSYDFARNGHRLGVTAAYYLSSVARTGQSSLDRQQNAIGTVSYSYGGRYLVEGVVDYAGSSRFRKGHRYDVFPSAGLGWVVSEEAFMQEADWVDFLKIRGQIGVLGYEDFGAQYLYEWYYQKQSGPTFGPSSLGSSSPWLGTGNYVSNKTTLQRLGNPDLTWEKRRELSVGFDAQLFSRRLYVSATYFRSKRDGIITSMTGNLPLYWGLRNVAVYENHNASLQQGVEAAFRFGGRTGDFGYSVGASFAFRKSKYLRYDESYTYAYQAVKGTALDAYRGYVYLGKFASAEEIASSPEQTFDEKLQPGDLKYADLNNDGRIDSNDQCVIGHTDPRFIYAVNLHLSYKWFDLTVVGTGRTGYQVPFTNAWFWNGWGDNNYSKFVKKNFGGDYPRIAYNKVNNNFQQSAYWLRDGGFFKIQNVELGFDAPIPSGSKTGIKGLRIFLRGANLLTISRIKDVDPESVDSGVSTYPLFRTFTAGINLTF